jgi:glycerol dehydrogenase
LLAEGCYRLLREHAVAGLRDAENGRVTEAVECVVEAAVLLSTLSFENAGLSIAHAVARGVPFAARAARTLHGEHVAYGLLVQFVLEGRPTVLYDDVVGFFIATGLPKCLADLDLDSPTPLEIEQVVEGTMGSPSVKRFSKAVSRELLMSAIHEVEDRAARLSSGCDRVP